MGHFLSLQKTCLPPITQPALSPQLRKPPCWCRPPCPQLRTHGAPTPSPAAEPGQVAALQGGERGRCKASCPTLQVTGRCPGAPHPLPIPFSPFLSSKSFSTATPDPVPRRWILEPSLSLAGQQIRPSWEREGLPCWRSCSHGYHTRVHTRRPSLPRRWDPAVLLADVH